MSARFAISIRPRGSFAAELPSELSYPETYTQVRMYKYYKKRLGDGGKNEKREKGAGESVSEGHSERERRRTDGIHYRCAQANGARGQRGQTSRQDIRNDAGSGDEPSLKTSEGTDGG